MSFRILNNTSGASVICCNSTSSNSDNSSNEIVKTFILDNALTLTSDINILSVDLSTSGVTINKYVEIEATLSSSNINASTNIMTVDIHNGSDYEEMAAKSFTIPSGSSIVFPYKFIDLAGVDKNYQMRINGGVNGDVVLGAGSIIKITTRDRTDVDFTVGAWV